ncbi:hypothetical protein Fmac_023935 [Flemingia macrophylla]|uniref:TF-B3 domain-containing protein n=1 Tax=Flemingia macrophylla TaxID=520843 RepID=A0ABD1LMY5_9FABA
MEAATSTEETTDSLFLPPPPPDADSRKLPSSKYKGVSRRAATSCTAPRRSEGEPWKAREQLFEKTVTPSDVGKLNRLVIPKQHAEKHFPLRCTAKGVLLNFEDAEGGKVWRFRYSYWNSSQSYVLTKGWSRFVKEKNLRAGDAVRFFKSTGPHRHLFIDCKPRSSADHAPGLFIPVPPLVEPVHMVRLFGVNLLKLPSSEGGKRKEMELFALECSKKLKVIGAL